MTVKNKKQSFFISGKESIVIYENKFLEGLTTCHHAVPFVIFVPVIIFAIYQTITFTMEGSISNPWYIVPLVIGGILLWTVIEYSGHRFVFHSQPNSAIGKKLLYLIHGAHHDYPNDPKRLVVPPIVSVPGGIVFYSVAYLLFGKYHAAPFFCALVSSYLFYDWFHYASHHMTIKNKYIRMLIKHHLMHHYKDPESGFGFTTTLWDKMLSTMFKN